MPEHEDIAVHTCGEKAPQLFTPWSAISWPTRISDSRLIVACQVIMNSSANHPPDVHKLAQLVSSNKLAFLICSAGQSIFIFLGSAEQSKLICSAEKRKLAVRMRSAEPRVCVLARLKSQDILLCCYEALRISLRPAACNGMDVLVQHGRAQRCVSRRIQVMNAC